ncbi:MAG TPA: hypothetical protein VJY15_26285 [Candidatus Acidoferrum sp.]|nr:hypothetical protein [Candidatus Acidoferrum sp.]
MGGAWENPRCKPVDPERAVLGRIGSERYGIPRIMDILEENNLRGTFFIEVFAALHGFQPGLTEAYSQIVKRGHDAQLHLHPIHYYYHLRNEGRLPPGNMPLDKDMIGAHPLEKQVEMLQQGISLFQEMIGKTPAAFRAGNFGASGSTLDALDKVGIHFDSSFNAAYLDSSCKLDSRGAINRPWQQSHVWEIPVTTFQTGGWGWCGLKQLNINAVSLWEMKSVLKQAERIGLRTVTFIAHSFSLFKVADLQFGKLKPDHLVVRRLHGLCHFLKENKERFRVVTYSDIDLSSFPGQEKGVPRMGTFIPVVRKAFQAVNRLNWL